MDKTDWLSWALLFSPVRLASSRALSPYGIMEYFQILVSCMMYRLAKSWNFVVCGKSSSSLIFRTSCHTRGEMIDDGPMSSEIREQNWSLIRIRLFISTFSIWNSKVRPYICTQLNLCKEEVQRVLVLCDFWFWDNDRWWTHVVRDKGAELESD